MASTGQNAQAAFAASVDALAKGSKKHPSPVIFQNNLLILPVLIAASIVVLLLSFILPRLYRLSLKLFSTRGYEHVPEEDEDIEEPPPAPPHMPSRGLASDFRKHIRSFRDAGTVLFAFEILRALSLGALLGLSIWAAIEAESPHHEESELVEVLKKKKHGKNKHKNHHDHNILDEYSPLELGEFGTCAFYAYNLLFALVLLCLKPATPLRRRLIKHVDTLLFLAFCLYAYRDAWPLLTTYLEPLDINHPTTWARLGLLTFVAVAIPLLRPRTYKAADPRKPTPTADIHPEQTANLLSLVTYEFMTGLVWRAWKVAAVPYEELHPLADYDNADFLYRNCVNDLDPYRRRLAGKGKRHLGLGLLSIFKWEAFITSLMAVISAAAELSGPFATNRILAYLEKGYDGNGLKPIVWVVFLFAGPLIGSLAIQWYVFNTTRALVRAQAILTQLLFDQALRLRMKDATEEEDEKDKKSTPEPPRITIEEAGAQGIAGVSADLVDELQPQREQDNGEPSADATAVGSPAGSSKDANGSAKPAAEAPAEEQKSGQGLAGKINVMMGTDIEAVTDGRDLPLVFVYAPIQLGLCVYFLYRILSWSAFVGMTFTLVTLPVPGVVTKWNAQYQKQRMEATDARVDVITEAIGALRMLKLFGWEDRMKDRIRVKREAELDKIKKRRWMSLSSVIVNIVLPSMTMAITYACYTLVEKKQLSAATVFSSMSVFEFLKGQMFMVTYLLNDQVTAYVSLNRINKFMHTASPLLSPLKLADGQSEMIDEFTEGRSVGLKSQAQLEAESEGLVRLRDARFTWGSVKGHMTPGFTLHVPDVTFVKGKINLITGPTGCGKSSLLQALVGELHFIKSDGSFFHLPREGGVSYAAQESWCLNETIKDNILFGEPYDADRYHAVIRACGLEPDLKILDDGDQTEIGEKGVTLSGGQKARVTLARAVYCQTAVLLLDDIFSALDTLTSRWIIEHLFKGDLIKGRTVLLITHHVGLVAPMADYIVSMNWDGTINSAGPVEEVAENDRIVQAAVRSDEVEVQKEEQAKEGEVAAKVEDEKKPSKLVQMEEKAEGRISKAAMFRFFKNFGGPVFWTTFFALVLAGNAGDSLQSYWLGLWARAYAEAEDPATVSVPFWLGFYFVTILVGMILLSAAMVVFFLYGAIRASRSIHEQLVDRIFGSHMRFLDSTPNGRIVSRFTKDMKSIDGSFVDNFESVVGITTSMLVKFVVVLLLVPLSGAFAVLIGLIGGFMGETYIHAQLSVKREMSNAKSPLFSHFEAAIQGIVSIRAFGAQDKLRNEAKRRTDKYTRTTTCFYNLNRWITVRVDALGSLFAAVLAGFLVYGPPLDASSAGFALSQAIVLSYSILWWVRMVNQMEVEGNSVERIEDYLKIAQEPTTDPKKATPASWPTSGEIVLDNLSAKYFAGGPTVLDNLRVTIKSGEKVGIVGRTGSGKSTLALAILRMIPTTGSVVIDGLKTEKMNLKDLRTNVTIIPQDPVLLSGSLRFNLDPFGDHDDAELNDALTSSGLAIVRHSTSGAATPMRLTLDSPISAGGSNLSQGQRQLVALARALVRNSKVFILDEATASVDFETDALIQKSIRNLPSSCTVLTVAHRLATVMDYDKIMVLGAGKLLEFDTPENLKNNKDSYFAKLVQAMEG